MAEKVSKGSSGSLTDEGMAQALRVREFIESLTHTKGEWAGQPFKLLDWQWEDVVLPLFGTMREDGARQYRICYVEIAKKNGKSELGAAIALYMLCADREASPEVYGVAADRQQASIVYQIAASMVRADPVLSSVTKILDSQKRIINYRNGGFYQVLSAESYTKHGLNPSAIIFDELHAQPDDELWRVLTSGTDYARRQQLVFTMSTAGIYDVESIWWRVREKARQIRDGIIEDRTWLPVLYIADPEKDDPHDEEVWKRVNPSLGRIFTLDKIRSDYEVAKQNPVDWADFQRYRLNIPIKHYSRWMPMDRWDKCGEKFNTDDLKGRTCYGGIDLSTRHDLSAFMLVFPPLDASSPDIDGKYLILTHCYCPESTIMERSRTDRVHYEVWGRIGALTVTSGDIIDYSVIERDVIQAAADYDLREVGYDPWGATEIAVRLLNEHGIQMVEVRQGSKSLSEPMKDVLGKVTEGRVAHGGHTVLRWCMDNLVVRTDPNENLRPDKQQATDRIDLAVALFNAWSRVILHTETSPGISLL